MAAQNKAAWLREANKPLEVGDAPLPTAGANELVIRNFAVAINPVDTHMQDLGIFVQQWPSVLGCDVAGEVFDVGVGAEGRFKKGDRVIAQNNNLTSGRPQDGAFQLYTVVTADRTAILPDHISFTDGVVLPAAMGAAASALFLKEPGFAMPNVPTPALDLPYPSLDAAPLRKTLVVYGGSASTGATVAQLAAAAGLHVVSIAGAANGALAAQTGAADVLDHRDPALADKVVAAVQRAGGEFVGIFDAVATDKTYPTDLAILARLGGGHLACTHPPPAEGVPANVKAGMIFAVNDAVIPVWRDFVTPALRAGKLKVLPPPTVVGKGLESIQEALQLCKKGVSGTKLVVEL